MHDGALSADQRTNDSAGDGLPVTLRDRIERDPDVRAAALAAARNWALVNPIPAWGLATGAGAEKLADTWGAAVVDRVLLAVADAIEAHSPATDEARFLASVRAEHDRDPVEWHRRMVEPPRTRSTECAFCGIPWDTE